MAIILTKRKNDQFREGSVIRVARTGSRACPVALTERLLLVGQHKESDYLFRKICHTKRSFSFRPQKLTYSRATELFKKQLKVIGLDPSQYGLHSLTRQTDFLICGMVAGPHRQLRTCTLKNRNKPFFRFQEPSVCERRQWESILCFLFPDTNKICQWSGGRWLRFLTSYCFHFEISLWTEYHTIFEYRFSI